MQGEDLDMELAKSLKKLYQFMPIQGYRDFFGT